MDTSVSELDMNVTQILQENIEAGWAWSRGFIGDVFVEVRGAKLHEYIYTFIDIRTGQVTIKTNYSDAANELQ